MLRLRQARGKGGGGRMSTIAATDLEAAVEDAAAYLYVWALKDIPQDLRDALAGAATKETSVPGQRVLKTILKNVQIADTENNLVCQDTGIAVYTCRVGEHFPLHPARIYAALKAGTERATIEHPLRSNAVHTITRENTGPNTGYRLPIVHWEFIPDWDGLDVKCVPKGSGSENMSFLKMCVPADGVKGIKQFVLESIVGPMGLGGDVTVLQVHVEHADTHMTLNPVAVNYQCWAARRATAHVSADGEVRYDREF
jgi:tartrate dehydratase alpha subunit/fumarate hydratase class I-like protein